MVKIDQLIKKPKKLGSKWVTCSKNAETAHQPDGAPSSYTIPLLISTESHLRAGKTQQHAQ